MGNANKETPGASCEGWARIASVVDWVSLKGIAPIPIAAPDDELREYAPGTIHVGEDGTALFQPASDPDNVYILRPSGETAFSGIDERTGNRITVNVDPFGVTVYDLHIRENDEHARAVAAAFSQR